MYEPEDELTKKLMDEVIPSIIEKEKAEIADYNAHYVPPAGAKPADSIEDPKPASQVSPGDDSKGQ